jgi:hypothetical protein
MTMTSTLLIVPGLRDHVAEHWQTHLAARLPNAHTVPPLDHDKLSCAARVAAVDAAFRALAGPVIIVAHSAGVMMVAHWARQHGGRVKGALLAAPADVESPFPEGYPTTNALRRNGWLPIPRQPLPFPALVAASENDPLCAFDRAAGMARDWGASLVNVGRVGHLNPAAGFGPWPRAEELIRDLHEADRAD